MTERQKKILIDLINADDSDLNEITVTDHRPSLQTERRGYRTLTRQPEKLTVTIDLSNPGKWIESVSALIGEMPKHWSQRSEEEHAEYAAQERRLRSGAW